MIDGGLFMMVLGAIGMGVIPIEAALAHRRWVKSIPTRAPIAQAFPIVPPDPAVEQIVEQLDR